MIFSKRFSTSNGNQTETTFGETKICDIKGTMKRIPQASKTLYDRYCNRYLNSSSRRIGPFIHLALLCGGIGYIWEYSHLKHQRDHREGHH